ncbi:MAG: tetraacyldisaccharide 4'-kinase [Thalassotalea sp.]|nr:tetraacyldisaccharide 4'-kinase [Thalassotalea sp.]
MRLIERVWFQGHRSKFWLVPLLLPLTFIFFLVTAFRRFCYRVGIKKQFPVRVPVLVIGNIGVGGNGKTPMVIYLIELCQQLGIKVGVVSRGYGGAAPHYPYLLNEQSSAKEAGDEPMMIYRRCGIPVAVGPDRVAAVSVLAEQGCQLVLADDGLQHYGMARAKELIVVDGKRQFGNGLLLPAGPLREGKWRLASVDMVVVNGDADITLNQASMTLSPLHMVNLATGEKLDVAEFAERNKAVVAIAAIGDPDRFFNTLKRCNIGCENAIGFVDHHAFSEQELTQVAQELPLVMTEKDAIKCQPFVHDSWWYLSISATFNEQDNQRFEALLNELI